MRVAMTGSTGLIGSALAARLEGGGHEVTAHPPRRARTSPAPTGIRRAAGSAAARSPGTTRS